MNVVQIVDSVDENARYALNAASVATAAATTFGYLPIVASILSIVWLSLQIYSFFEKRWTDWKARR